MVHIKEWADVKRLKPGETGAVLTLEGADAFGNDLMKLRTFYRLGVKSVGLTWNNANLCADGVGEPRGGGLTELGFEAVKLNNVHQVWTDVSHLAEPGFWDVMRTADWPVATHSNSKTICGHRRNLTDEQAQALFRKKGLLGVVFNPPFIGDGKETASIGELIRHIDHFCELGGKNHLAFGSDFDGIAWYVKDLEHAGRYQNLINELLKNYSETDVRGFASENVLRFLQK
jgi:membrane dipeptidase